MIAYYKQKQLKSGHNILADPGSPCITCYTGQGSHRISKDIDRSV